LPFQQVDACPLQTTFDSSGCHHFVLAASILSGSKEYGESTLAGIG
jgi:hypothetical protein